VGVVACMERGVVDELNGLNGTLFFVLLQCKARSRDPSIVQQKAGEGTACGVEM
jgi:hypothetical protein